MTTKVYLAGPIQHASDHGKGWRERLKKGDISHEADDFEFIDPMDKYNTHELEETEWTSETIIKDDLELIADCDAILVHWLEVPTCGTPMEVFFSKYFPQVSAAMLDMAHDLAEQNDTGATVEMFNALEEYDVDVWMRDVMLMTAMKEEIPVVVQTRVPPEEISPWLSFHSDAIVETFADSVHWIENNVNDGNAPEPEGLKAEYELVSA